jgi:hypothetical protein
MAIRTASNAGVRGTPGVIEEIAVEAEAAQSQNQRPVGSGTDDPIERQVLLRAEFADRYPNIPAGTWMVAFAARHLVRYMLSQSRGGWRLVKRLLSQDHFSFRGGDPPGTYEGIERREAPHRVRRPSGGQTQASE